MSKPSKLEVLEKLVHVLDRQDADRREAAATRNARHASDENVLSAIARGENTWERLHTFFPDAQWTSLGGALTRLQRAGVVHRDRGLTFRMGPRKGRD